MLLINELLFKCFKCFSKKCKTKSMDVNWSKLFNQVGWECKIKSVLELSVWLIIMQFHDKKCWQSNKLECLSSKISPPFFQKYVKIIILVENKVYTIDDKDYLY